jgi:hypothetical protein
MMRKTAHAALALGLLSLATPFAASAAPNVVIAQTYTVADSPQNATTDTTVIHSDTGHLLRGEQLHYSVVATNQGDRAEYAIVAMLSRPLAAGANASFAYDVTID